MTTPIRSCPLRRGLLAWALLPALALADTAQAAGQPLWGYGVRSCADYTAASAAPDTGDLGRYEDWLTGFISGLNLATGEDVLRGSDIQTAMKRTLAFCKGKPDTDFFNATMDLVRSLRALRR